MSGLLFVRRSQLYIEMEELIKEKTEAELRVYESGLFFSQSSDRLKTFEELKNPMDRNKIKQLKVQTQSYAEAVDTRETLIKWIEERLKTLESAIMEVNKQLDAKELQQPVHAGE